MREIEAEIELQPGKRRRVTTSGLSGFQLSGSYIQLVVGFKFNTFGLRYDMPS